MSDNIGYNTHSRTGGNFNDDQQFVDQPSLQDNSGYEDVSGFNSDARQQSQTYGATQGTDTDFYGGNDNTQGRTDAAYNNDNLDSNISSYGNADMTQTSYGDNTDLGGNAGYRQTHATTGYGGEGRVTDTSGLQNSSYGTTDNSITYGSNDTTGAYGSSDQPQFGSTDQPMSTGGNLDQPYHHQQNVGDHPQAGAQHQQGIGGKVEGMLEKLADKISPGHGKH
ncbi:hypothetical protein EDC96DRAFT_510069 [Choanephora cucurbitarum]|nr:hypothetical protein EDC96DRAFT_510069 [Choanephora cucurbitarum]